MEYGCLDRLLLGTIEKMTRPVVIPVILGSKPADEGEICRDRPAIRVKDRQALMALVLNPDVSFGDLYSSGRVEVEGDLVRLLEQIYRIPESAVKRSLGRLMRCLPSNGLQKARENISRHYDLSTDFYQLWLDPELVYTCAYFPRPEARLEEAQRAKLDLVCRKVWLQPGETVVEAGCGWGALALHMAKHFGVRVKAFNISHEQIAFARERAKREGLSSQVEFCEDDYRNIKGRFDAFVSVGMLEHVGRSHYLDLSEVIQRTVGARGRGLVHFIGRNYPRPLDAWIRKRIFPGAYPPVLREAMKIFELQDLCVLDLENLSAHYAKTLEAWRESFQRVYEPVVDRFGSSFARMWELYLAGSTAAFRAGTLQLFQIVWAGRECTSRPWNREYLYKDARVSDGTWMHAML